MKQKYLLLILLLPLLACLACPADMTAQTGTPVPNHPAADSIRISLLTCAAGEEIYSLFGHTAIRYENPARGIDAVFNYGLFDFSAPNFVLRFALGETDYRLGATDYEYFAAEYGYLERDVWQQELNLTPGEKRKLVALLEENYRPENRVYRYNFFYDNCATRPRDLIEKSINGSLHYAADMTSTDTGTSFRDLLHRYSEGHPWSRFGMDLCMGSQADKPISRRTMMFVPFCLQADFRQARIAGHKKETAVGKEETAAESEEEIETESKEEIAAKNEEGIATKSKEEIVAESEAQERPLVLREEKIVDTGSEEAGQPADGFTPMHAALLLLLLTAAATIYGLRRRKTLWVADLVLFFAAGTAGCILAFLALFSQHPAVSPNYLLFVFHPFHLFCLPWMLNRVRKRRKSRYMQANFIVLTLFILSWPVIPQQIPLSVLPLALCLLIRSAGNWQEGRSYELRATSDKTGNP